MNEIDLMGRLKDEVGPVPAEVSERARMVLRAAMAVDESDPASADTRVRRHLLRSSGRRVAAEGDHQVFKRARHPKRQRRAAVVRGGVAAGVAAAVAALALVATLPDHSSKVPAAANHAAPPLVRLADYVSGSPTPSGDATLVVRTTALGGGKSATVYDLYTDNGQFFFSQTESGLAGQVSTGHNLAGGLFAREIAAAKLAATGNVQTAGEDMAAAPDPSKYIPQTTTQTISGANAAKEPGTYHAGEAIGTYYDNYVWENSQDALIAGSGDPQVRAGVLRILATLPDVTVKPGTSGGQSTLVLTAGTAEIGVGSTEQLTINSTTGVPVSFASGTDGQTPTRAVTYQVSRVTTSDIAAGKL